MKKEISIQIFEQVKSALPTLSDIIYKRLGFYVELKVLHNENNIKLFSEKNLIEYLGDSLVRTMFSKVEINFWGGTLLYNENKIWFNPKLSYDHPRGGSNGTDFLWNSLYFNIDTNEWIEGDFICEVNNVVTVVEGDDKGESRVVVNGLSLKTINILQSIYEKCIKKYPIGTKFKVVHCPEVICKITSNIMHQNCFIKSGGMIHINMLCDTLVIEDKTDRTLSASVATYDLDTKEIKYAEIVG